MSFINKDFIVIVLVSFVAISFLTLHFEKKFFQWVKSFWFHKRSKLSYFSSFLYLLGLGLLLVALLDLRGPQEKKQGQVSDQKTLILIDSSLSMLVQDVRPNRFQKAIFMARHFIKKASGHKISIVLFSDNTKRLVPFTNDIELLDARVSGLIEKGASGGGSNINKSIRESLKFFSVDGDQSGGNIVIFSDGETHEKTQELDLGEKYSVAFVGIGTKKGGDVPLGNAAHLQQRNKRVNGKPIVSKLDELAIQKLGKKIKYFKYWLASTYSLPTEEILNFLSKSKKAKEGKDSILTRPVYAQYLVIPGLLLLSTSFLFKNFAPIYLSFLLFASLTIPKVNAQPTDIDPKEIERQKYLEQAGQYMKKWKEKGLTHKEKMSLASKLLQADENKRANSIYKENLGDVNASNADDYFNWATSDLKEKKFGSALGKLDTLNKYLESSKSKEDEALKKKVRENILFALKNSKDKGGKGKSKDKKKGKNGKNGDKDNSKLSGEKRMKQLDKKNVSGVLKQIMDADRNLQKKYLDTSTKDKGKKGGAMRRDW